MAHENFLLSPCTPSDLPSMINVYLAAFAPDPLCRVTFPLEVIGEAEMRRWMAEYLTALFRKPEVHMYKVTETDTGNMAAWMRCVFPHVLTEQEKEERKLAGERTWPKGANLEALGAKFGVLSQMKEKYVDDAQTYFVQILATDPSYQRRGLATKLLKLVLDIADKEGKVSYLEATDAGWPVYRKLGYKEIDILEMNLSKWGGTEVGRNRILLREPQPIL